MKIPDTTDLKIPKGFLTGIRVPYGPMEGSLAQPCMCGYPTSLEEETLYLIQWEDGRLMFCHPGCVRGDEDDEYA